MPSGTASLNLNACAVIVDMDPDQQRISSDQTVNLLHNISQILDTGLDKETLRLLIGLVEAGVNPEALALIVKELRRAGAEAGAAAAPEASSQ